MRMTWLVAVLLAVPSSAALGQAAKPEKPHVTIGVGGKSFMIYLPLTVTERLGYFKDAGLDVEITDFQSGTRSLQALIGGNVDVTAGSYDHTIQMQAKGQTIVAVVETGRYPGIVLGLVKAKHLPYRSPADLKGLKIGVTAPGSQTNFMVNYILVKAGLKRDDASFIGVGGPAAAVAAARKGEIDALSHADPAISELEAKGEIDILFDTRTTAGTHAVFGGDYPSSVLYVRPDFAAHNPNTVQALVTATVRALRWIAKASPEEIAKVMPEEYAAGNRALYVTVIGKSKPFFSPDGRVNRQGAENAHKVLAAFDPAVGSAKIDLAATYSDRFVDAAPTP
jgi:NitT/TauT family transport system substrate-binding protein